MEEVAEAEAAVAEAAVVAAAVGVAESNPMNFGQRVLGVGVAEGFCAPFRANLFRDRNSGSPGEFAGNFSIPHPIVVTNLAKIHSDFALASVSTMRTRQEFSRSYDELAPA